MGSFTGILFVTFFSLEYPLTALRIRDVACGLDLCSGILDNSDYFGCSVSAMADSNGIYMKGTFNNRESNQKQRHRKRSTNREKR